MLRGVRNASSRDRHVTHARRGTDNSESDEFDDEGQGAHDEEDDELRTTDEMTHHTDKMTPLDASNEGINEGNHSCFQSNYPYGDYDSAWLDDDRFGCTPGQLMVNALAAVAATQNPKHATYFCDFLAKVKNELHTANIDKLTDTTPPMNVTDPGWWASWWITFSDTSAYELRWLSQHPTKVVIGGSIFSVLFITFNSRRKKAKKLKADLLSDGVDLTNVASNHVETLEYITAMKKEGNLPIALEQCALQKAETDLTYLGVNALKDWREYYLQRGIDLATKSDVAKVKQYVGDLHHLEGCLKEEQRID